MHALPSVQAFELSFGCVQVPPPHTSSVQGFPSQAHGAVLLAKTQPVPGLQESSVHPFESLQTIGVPTHTPLEHASPVVQALLSVQEVPFATGV